MRKLASIQKIDLITPIEGADNIEKATIKGWEVVVKKGEFKAGDIVVYCEIDSILPDGMNPEDLTLLKETEKTLKARMSELGISKNKDLYSSEDATIKSLLAEIDTIQKRNTRYEFEFLRDRKFRIKSIKLRGVISQGIIFPTSILNNFKTSFDIDTDLTELLGVIKYEPIEEMCNEEIIVTEDTKYLALVRIREHLRHFVLRHKSIRWMSKFFPTAKKIDFPSTIISKTDEERIQNIPEILERAKDIDFYVTEKVDGTSCTMIYKDDKFLVCGRNGCYITPVGNHYWGVALKYKVKNILKSIGHNIAIQGEVIGNGIQGNHYHKSLELRIFTIKNLDTNTYYTVNEIKEFSEKYGIPIVPILFESTKLKPTVKEMLEFAEGKSELYDGEIREGMVWRENSNEHRRLSFKCISNQYLLKYGKEQ